MQAPRIVYKAGFTVVGFAHQGEMSEGQKDALWDKLGDRFTEIQLADPDAGYGVHTWLGSKRSYLAGLAVRECAQVPVGMTAQAVNAHAYAVFVHVGAMAGLTQTVGWIYDAWLPESNYERDEDLYFEYFDDRFQPGSRDSVVFLWVPVREKVGKTRTHSVINS